MGPYIWDMERKSDLILLRLFQEFRWVSYGSIKDHINYRIPDEDMVLIRNGELSKEVYIHMTVNDARFNIALYEDHFCDMSLEYFKKFLRVFLLEHGLDPYSRVVKWDFHLFRRSPEFISQPEPKTIFTPKINDHPKIHLKRSVRLNSNMYVAWRNQIKVFHNLVAPLKKVS